jgi:hypothetical protein
MKIAERHTNGRVAGVGKKIFVVLAILGCIVTGGTLPSFLQRTDIQTELAGLAKRGIAYRMLDDETIELANPVIGSQEILNVREPDEVQIRNWAAERDIPILEIDPTLTDTIHFSG